MPDMSQANMAEMSLWYLTAIAHVHLQFTRIFIARQQFLPVLQYPQLQLCMPINLKNKWCDNVANEMTEGRWCGGRPRDR